MCQFLAKMTCWLWTSWKCVSDCEHTFASQLLALPSIYQNIIATIPSLRHGAIRSTECGFSSLLSSFAYAHGGTESGKKQRKDRNRERHFTVLQRKSLFHGTYATTKLMYMAGALEFLSWKWQTDSATFSHSPNRIPRDFPLVLSHLTRECPCPSVPQREIAAFGTVRRSRERKQFNLGLKSWNSRSKAEIRPRGWSSLRLNSS